MPVLKKISDDWPALLPLLKMQCCPVENKGMSDVIFHVLNLLRGSTVLLHIPQNLKIWMITGTATGDSHKHSSDILPHLQQRCIRKCIACLLSTQLTELIDHIWTEAWTNWLWTNRSCTRKLFFKKLKVCSFRRMYIIHGIDPSIREFVLTFPWLEGLPQLRPHKRFVWTWTTLLVTWYPAFSPIHR